MNILKLIINNNNTNDNNINNNNINNNNINNNNINNNNIKDGWCIIEKSKNKIIHKYGKSNLNKDIDTNTKNDVINCYNNLVNHWNNYRDLQNIYYGDTSYYYNYKYLIEEMIQEERYINKQIREVNINKFQNYYDDDDDSFYNEDDNYDLY